VIYQLLSNRAISYGLFNAFLHHLMNLLNSQQKGTFETGQEDTAEIPEDLRLRLAYREAAVAVLACYFPEPHRPIVEVTFLYLFFVEQLHCV
jgi:hypothetical protein